MKPLQADAGVMAEINITPFTDVLLVLLIIFMILAALVTPPGFQRAFQQPCAKCATPIHVPARIELSITRFGKMFIGSVPVDTRSIYGSLLQAYGAKPHSKLAIIADTRAPYGLVLRALDAAKEAGIGEVSFVTQ